MSSEKLETRKQEKYNAKLYEYKESHKKTLCYMNIFSTVATIGCAVITLFILNSNGESCEGSNLRLTLWLMLGMHVINATEAIFGLL